jgi:hypothetical protein
MRSTSLLLAALSLLAPALASDCKGFGVASNPGDTCESFAKQWKTTVDELKRLNPGITCPDLPYINDTYCVNEGDSASTSALVESSSSSSVKSGSTTASAVESSATPTVVSTGSAASYTTPLASATGSPTAAKSSAAPSGSSGAEVLVAGSYGLVAGIAGVFALL